MDDARLFLCARCRRQVLICSRCDRGQRYCGARCSGPARRESLRAAGRRYQHSRRGRHCRHCHAERQRRYPKPACLPGVIPLKSEEDLTGLHIDDIPVGDDRRIDHDGITYLKLHGHRYWLERA